MGTTTRSIGSRSTKPKNFKPKNGCTRLHAPPRTRDDPRPNPSNMCKSAQGIKKLTIPWCSTASNLQNLKISGPKSPPRAATRRQSCCHDEDAPPDPSRAYTRRLLFRACHARPRTMLTRASASLTSPMTSFAECLTRTDPDRTENLTQIRTTWKKKKIN